MCQKKYSERVSRLVRDISAVFPKVEDRIVKTETYSLVRAAACSLCEKALTENEVQFVSLVEADFAMCESCEASKGEGQGSHKLAHPYSVYRLHPQASNLDDLLVSVSEMKQDTVHETDPQDLTHGCTCDNSPTGECGGKVIGVRWKCAHCRDYDLCDNCHSNWISDPSERSREEASKSNHYEWHVFIKKPLPN
mmetsp:Transcript_19538/g.35763  ORF Transcript_19538/g.35763 Transcript_19538/m.35763 type:complete len:194 (+) Transcript_19538:935-1516(+)